MMKRILALAWTLFLGASLAQGQGYLRDDATATHTSGITINEVGANPQNKGSGIDYNADGSISNQDEYVEIVNSSTSSIDIGGWTLGDDGSTFTFPTGTIVTPLQAVVVFAANISNFNPGSSNQVFTAGFALHNTNEAVGLRNQDNLYIAVHWGSGTPASAITSGATLVGSDVDLIGFGSVGRSRTRSPDYSGSFTSHSTLFGTFNWSNDSPTRTLTDPMSSPGRFEDDASVLPVELVSFEATRDGADVLLHWTTASETNNAGFFIELRAVSTTGWEMLGFVEGYGTTLEAQHYTYRSTGLDPGRYTFRLRQVDYDGTFDYSPEVEVAVEMVASFIVGPVYPNPFNSEATLRFALQQPQAVRADLFDVLGRRVRPLFEDEAVADQVVNVLIDGRDLPSGVYLVRLAGEYFATTQRITLVK